MRVRGFKICGDYRASVGQGGGGGLGSLGVQRFLWLEFKLGFRVYCVEVFGAGGLGFRG